MVNLRSENESNPRGGMIMLVRWTPFTEMGRLQHDLNRMFDSFDARPLAKAETVQGLWTPAVDVVEDADKIELLVDLPGVKQEELEIQVEKRVLTLRGARKAERSEPKGDKENFRRYERVTGGFVRSFTLPETVDLEKIAAALKDGVLTLTLPKKPEAQPKQIKVAVQ
jgi:HSP20 family protein